MKFTKIKYSEKNGVHLEWTTPVETKGKLERTADDVVHHWLESKDEPAPAFVDALQQFRDEVRRLLELPLSYEERLVVIGLSINYEDDSRLGLVVTCLKELERTNAPLVLNTPHLREASDEDTGNYLPDTMLELLKEATNAAAAFVQGARSQASLFDTPAESKA